MVGVDCVDVVVVGIDGENVVIGMEGYFVEKGGVFDCGLFFDCFVLFYLLDDVWFGCGEI